jgi:hypothetical protein
LNILRYNGFGDEGAKILGEGLSKMLNLSDINLDFQ